MKKRIVGIGLVVICIIGMMTNLVYCDPKMEGEESDGDHDRLQDRDHPNEDIMKGVGNYDIKEPPRSGIGAS